MNIRLALTLFVLTAMARSVTADYVTWNVVDLKGDPYSKTVVRFTPVRGWTADGTNTIVDVARSATPSATGGGRTKVLGGVYKVTADGASGSILIAVPGDGGEYTLNQVAQYATNCPPFFFTNFFGRISERVKVSGEGVSIVTNNPGAWNEYISLAVAASSGPTSGITSLQATNIAASIAADTNAALRSAIAASSNSVIQTLNSYAADTNSVRYYGAKGDNVTDDTAAFQAAYAATRTVKVPPGDYRISNTWATNHVRRIEGQGPGSRLIFTGDSGAAINCLSNAVDVVGLNFVVETNFHFYTNWVPGSRTALISWSVADTNGPVRVQYNSFSGFSSNAILVIGWTDPNARRNFGIYSGNLITNCTTGVFLGVNNAAEYCVVEMNSISGCNQAIKSYSPNVPILNNIIHDNANGIYLAQSANNRGHSLIDGNQINHCGNAQYVMWQPSHAIYVGGVKTGVSITSNQIMGNGSSYVYFYDCGAILFTGNVLEIGEMKFKGGDTNWVRGNVIIGNCAVTHNVGGVTDKTQVGPNYTRYGQFVNDDAHWKIFAAQPASGNLTNWSELSTNVLSGLGGSGAVSSVNGQTGAVTLDAADVGAEPALGFAPQPATANGTNWSSISTNVITELRQEIADTTLPANSLGWTNISVDGGDTARLWPLRDGELWGDGYLEYVDTAGFWRFGQGVRAPSLSVGDLTVTNGIAATNLTGTIDAARLPVATTNAIWGGINLSNPAVNAIYMLSITTNTTLGAFGNLHASEFRTAQLWVQNTAGSNCTVALPDGTSCPDGNPLYVTNGQRRVVSIGGIINFTNAISRALP